MKILMVNDYESKIGGAEYYIDALQKKLEEKGHKVVLFSSKKSVSGYQSSQLDKSVKKYINKFFNYGTYKEFNKTLKSYKPDVIHIHNIFNEISPSFLANISRTPVVMTVHDNLLVNTVSILSGRTGKTCKSRMCEGCYNCIGIKGAMYEFIKRRFHRVLFKKVRLFITPSKYMKEFVLEAGYSPVKHILNGFELFNYASVTNFNDILYVGRLSSEKGVKYLLESMPVILKKKPSIRLKIIGDGDQKDFLTNLVKRLKLEKSISFLPALPQNQLYAHYKSATLIVVPSIYDDNLPTVIIEAMSVGRVVIGTNKGGIPELIEDGKTGYLINSMSSIQIANKVLKLVTNKKLIIEMSNNARKASQKYSMDKHVSLIENIYKKVL